MDEVNKTSFAVYQSFSGKWGYFRCWDILSHLIKALLRPFSFPQSSLNSLSANPTKWSITRKQFLSNLLTSCSSVFDHSVKLALKGLTVSLTKNHLCFGVSIVNFEQISSGWVRLYFMIIPSLAFSPIIPSFHKMVKRVKILRNLKHFSQITSMKLMRKPSSGEKIFLRCQLEMQERNISRKSLNSWTHGHKIRCWDSKTKQDNINC